MRYSLNLFMLVIYGVCSFILSSSAVMVGYVWIRDIKNTRSQAAMLTGENTESAEATLSEEIQQEYPQLLKKIA